MKKTLLLLIISLTAFFQSYAQRDNNCLSFGGAIPDNVNVGDITGLNNCSSFSFEAWIYVETWKSWGQIFRKTGPNGDRIDIELSNQVGKVYVHIYNQQSGNAIFHIDAGLTTNGWQHVALTYDYSLSPQVCFYVDGVNLNIPNPTTIPSTTSNGVGHSLKIGSNFLGKIDEVRIWDKSLSALDVENRFKGTITSLIDDYTNLLAYYPFDNNEEFVVDQNELTETKYHGQINGNVEKVEVNDNANFFYKEYATFISDWSVYKNVWDNFDLDVYNAVYFIGPLMSTDDYIVKYGEKIYQGLDFTRPTNNASVVNVTLHQEDLDGRTEPLLHFNEGAETQMNCGRGIFIDVDNSGSQARDQFTFETWLYCEDWDEGAFLFKKKQDLHNCVSMELAEFDQSTSKGAVKINICNGSTTSLNTVGFALPLQEWVHVAVTYDGPSQQVMLYVDGEIKPLQQNGNIPIKLPKIREDFIIGENFNGYLDEIRIFHKAISQSTINQWMTKTFDMSHPNKMIVASHYPVSEPTLEESLKDSQGWLSMVDKIVENVRSDAKMIVTIAGGPWKDVFQNTKARKALAKASAKIVNDYDQIDGIDFDFEWPSASNWPNYNKFIREVNAELNTNKELRVGLRSNEKPLVEADVRAMIDAYPVQVYDNEFMDFYHLFSHLDESKLNYGQGFFAWANGGPIWSYKRLFEETENEPHNNNPALNPTLDEVIVNGKTMKFTGKNSMRRKTQDILNNNMKGMFLWTIGQDISNSEDSFELVIRSIINPNNELPAPETAPMAINEIGLTNKESLIKFSFEGENTLLINGSFGKKEVAYLSVYNFMGEKLIQQKVKLLSVKSSKLIRLPNLQEGYYIVNLHTGTEKISKKIYKN